MIKKEFANTLPFNRILKVEMVQNYYLWKSYALSLDQYKFKNQGKDPKELYLWHGTKKNNPRLIARGDEGLTLS